MAQPTKPKPNKTGKLAQRRKLEKEREKAAVIEWLRQRYRIDNNCDSILKKDIYTEFIIGYNPQPAVRKPTQAVFGKMLRLAFPAIEDVRLMRGIEKGKCHYYYKNLARLHGTPAAVTTATTTTTTTTTTTPNVTRPQRSPPTSSSGAVSEVSSAPTSSVPSSPLTFIPSTAEDFITRYPPLQPLSYTQLLNNPIDYSSTQLPQYVRHAHPSTSPLAPMNFPSPPVSQLFAPVITSHADLASERRSSINYVQPLATQCAPVAVPPHLVPQLERQQEQRQQFLAESRRSSISGQGEMPSPTHVSGHRRRSTPDHVSHYFNSTPMPMQPAQDVSPALQMSPSRSSVEQAKESIICTSPFVNAQNSGTSLGISRALFSPYDLGVSERLSGHFVPFSPSLSSEAPSPDIFKNDLVFNFLNEASVDSVTAPATIPKVTAPQQIQSPPIEKPQQQNLPLQDKEDRARRANEQIGVQLRTLLINFGKALLAECTKTDFSTIPNVQRLITASFTKEVPALASWAYSIYSNQAPELLSMWGANSQAFPDSPLFFWNERQFHAEVMKSDRGLHEELVRRLAANPSNMAYDTLGSFLRTLADIFGDTMDSSLPVALSKPMLEIKIQTVRELQQSLRSSADWFTQSCAIKEPVSVMEANYHVAPQAVKADHQAPTYSTMNIPQHPQQHYYSKTAYPTAVSKFDACSSSAANNASYSATTSAAQNVIQSSYLPRQSTYAYYGFPQQSQQPTSNTATYLV